MPINLLIPVDGSEPSLRAVAHAAKRAVGGAASVHLINVQAPLPNAVSGFLSKDVVRDFHREQAAKDTAGAEKLLTEKGIAFKTHVAVGAAGETIADYAKQNGMDEIVIGARGLGALGALLMGSTTVKVLHLADIPVTVVK